MAMLLIKIGQRIINLNNVKFIELSEITDKGREIRFYFIDGSFSYCIVKKEEENREFDVAWEYLSGLWVFSRVDSFFK
jgi:hypothetical protein